jgi:transmembrane sensor
MNQIVDIPGNQQIREEASEWLIRLDSDEAPTVEELTSMREWISRSARHRTELERLAKHWDNLNVLTELSVPITAAQRTAPHYGVFAAPRIVMAMAAAVIVVMVVALNWQGLSGQAPASDNRLYATAIGQQQTISLDDSSSIVLNTNSQVKVDYTSEYRLVRLLQGEAHFEVASDPLRPFRVLTSSGYVEAVGTAFSVRLREKSVDVVVTEGKVRLQSELQAIDNREEAPTGQFAESPPAEGQVSNGDNHGTMLSAGQVGVFPLESTSNVTNISTLTVTDAELARRTAWKNGLLFFSGEPLSQVVSEISRYTTVKIEILDPDVQSIRIGGQFPVGATELMFESLETNFGLTVTHTGPNTVVLAAAPTDAR